MFEFERSEQPLRKLEDTKQWLVEQTSCKRHSERKIYWSLDCRKRVIRYRRTH